MYQAEMRELQKEAFSVTSETPLSKYFDKTQKFQKYLIDQNAQKVLNLETKSKIFSKKKSL